MDEARLHAHLFRFMKKFWVFLQELLTTWWGGLWAALGAVSTIATFVPLYVHGVSVPRSVPAILAVGSWLLAPYRLYCSQKSKISELELNVAQQKTAELVVYPHQRSAFYVQIMDNKDIGTYLELSLMVENKGERNSIVTKYEIAVDEIDAAFRQVGAQPRNAVQTRSALMAGLSQDFITRDNSFTVPAHALVKGILPIYIDSSPAVEVVQLHVTLRLTDTQGIAATYGLALSRIG